MKVILAKKPVGTSNFHLFLIAVWEYLFNGQFPFVDTDTVKWNRGPTGYAASAAPPGAGGNGTAAKSNFRGIYVPASYNTFDEVVLQGGPVAGEYISTADGNTNAPTTGINWIQVSSLTQWF